MTRKDYVMLAYELAHAHVVGDTAQCRDINFGVDNAARRIASRLSDENPRGFDRELFLRNAGVTG
jgi:hypothetical protein